MYRRLFYSVYLARNRAVEACVSPTKCDIPALTVFRVVNGGVKAFSTSPINYCEKSDSLPPKQDGKSSTSMEGKVDNSENKVTEMSQQVPVVGVVKSEAASTIQQMDDISTPEDQNSKDSTSEERLEVRLEEGKAGLGVVDVGLVQTEADSTIQQMDIISTPEVQKSKESTSEERLEVRLEEDKEGAGVVEVGVVQAEADNTIQHMDDIGTQEVQKSKESSSEQRLEVRLEEDKEGEVMVEVGVVQAEADNTIQQMDDIGTPEVQKSKESTTEERLEVRLEEDKEGERMVEVGVVQAAADSTIQHMDDISTPEVQKSIENTSEESLDVNIEQGTEGLGMVELKNTEHTTSSSSSKISKESLLDLLAAMKVDVTSKKKFKSMKFLQSSTPTPPKPKPEPMESAESMFQKATEEASVQSDTLNPELVAAASAAAATLPNQSQAESELLRQLRKHEAVAEAQKKGEVNNLGDIIADMKVGKGPNRQNAWPANQIRFDDDGRGYVHDRYVHDRGITAELNGVRRRRALFSGKRLGIFSPTVDKEAESAIVRPTLWDIDFTNQIVLSTNQSPRNALEEMVQWTKEGKLWEYPINNEAGLEEEMSVPFHEHIFLEKHLVEGFPQQGPVRHFMELVVAGLASNAHLTVQQKKDHIAWFRDYFHQKEDVLKEADVYLN